MESSQTALTRARSADATGTVRTLRFRALDGAAAATALPSLNRRSVVTVDSLLSADTPGAIVRRHRSAY